jgi:hypothetical protein
MPLRLRLFANETEDRGFESRLGVRIFGAYIHHNAVLCNLIRIVCCCVYLDEKSQKYLIKRRHSFHSTVIAKVLSGP